MKRLQSIVKKIAEGLRPDEALKIVVTWADDLEAQKKLQGLPEPIRRVVLTWEDAEVGSDLDIP